MGLAAASSESTGCRGGLSRAWIRRGNRPFYLMSIPSPPQVKSTRSSNVGQRFPRRIGHFDIELRHVRTVGIKLSARAEDRREFEGRGSAGGGFPPSAGGPAGPRKTRVAGHYALRGQERSNPSASEGRNRCEARLSGRFREPSGTLGIGLVFVRLGSPDLPLHHPGKSTNRFDEFLKLGGKRPSLIQGKSPSTAAAP